MIRSRNLKGLRRQGAGQLHKCGTTLLSDFLEPAFTDALRRSPFTGTQWENVPISATSERPMKVTTDSTFGDFVKELRKNLEPFACHLFNARW